MYGDRSFYYGLIGAHDSIIKSINRDSLLFPGFEYAQFNPSENDLCDFLQSGRLNLITNNYLKKPALPMGKSEKEF